MGLSSNNKMKIEGGMASMTDLVFLLLIFFIIMSLMSNDQFTVDLPETTEVPTERTNVTPTLEVTKDNLYIIEGVGDSRPGELEDIKELVKSKVDGSNDTKLKIAGDKEATYEAVFAALALCQANGWDPVLAYNK